MSIVPLPLPAHVEARALLHLVLEHGDVVGRDSAGRTVIQLAVDDHTLDRLLTFNVDAAEVEDQGDDEFDPDDEADCPPVAGDLVRPKVITPRERCAGTAPPERPRLRLATSN